MPARAIPTARVYRVEDDRGAVYAVKAAVGARVDADYIRQSILDPGADAADGFEQYLAPLAMPATFGDQLTASQLEAVVQFLVSQR